MKNCLLHNLRQKTYLDEYIDPERSEYNIYGGARTIDELQNIYREKMKLITSKRKIQKNASKMIEFVFSYSHEFCKNWETDKKEYETVRKHFNEIVEFVKVKYGDVIITYAIHFDETTPHIHIFCIPLVFDKSGCKYSSSDFIGGIKDIKALHTDLYEMVGKNFGLGRGKEGSRARHVSLGEYKHNEETYLGKIQQKEKELEGLINSNRQKEETLSREIAETEHLKQVMVETQKANIKQNIEIINKLKVLDESEKAFKYEIPQIPDPPLMNKQSWRDGVQETITDFFNGIKAAFQKLIIDYKELNTKHTTLKFEYEKMKFRAETAEKDLAEKPIEEISAIRERKMVRILSSQINLGGGRKI
ncbi:putative mobilization protein [Leadbettera azotonutricia ZAS-9]|uniref:Putative mobilization protein n=1 Tax=Leadbettera azotonutricia (strain ATCC BAA-888 / DSM 13862 / ZAS-9) TaxID=545695 RepID=F5YDG7_LEAAZ|nr:putative mobilization protein [Leadbettera azotonutricia ZAS-9]